jgi:tripartite-type tricarboxylate transporter receptor subunit TctC
MHRMLLVLALSMPLAAWPQAYPSKPIRMIVPYPPGGVDAGTRVMAPRMGELLGQPIVIENRGGANGVIGAELVARSPADGYTLLFPTSSTMVGAVKTMKEVPWDPLKDFTSISFLYDNLRIITVHASLPVNSLRDLIDYAKKNPGKLSYGSSGIGSAFHLDGEVFKAAAGIDILHVPYKGTGPMLTDMAAGRVEVGVGSISSIEPHIKSGKLKLLAFMEKKRAARYPDVPTVSETLPGTSKIATWIGMMGPAGLPRPVLMRIHSAAVGSMQSPEAKAYFVQTGAEVVGSSPEELAELIRDSLEQLGKLLDRMNLKPS